jgi:N-acetylglucosamine malate deacetylase 1
MKYPKALHNFIRFAKQRAQELFSQYHHVENLPGPNVLVLAPHPDDDVFGCGGTIIKHIRLGHKVSIAYLCQGDKGVAHLGTLAASKIRKQEAINAASILGLSHEHLFFMDNFDHELNDSPKVIDSVNTIIRQCTPNIIYLPSFIDQHVDHIAANAIISRCGLGDIWIAGYEVWTPQLPNRIVDISDVMEIKIEAMKAHSSQIAMLNYCDAITSLNKYRACLYPKEKFEYAESFLMLRAKEYCDLYRVFMIP